MSVTASNVLAGGGAPSAGANTTASWTPDGTSQYILNVSSYVSAGSTPPVISGVSGNGLTWTQLGTANGDATGADQTAQYMFAVPAGGSAGAITISWSTSPTRASWTLDKIAGAASGLGSGSLPQASVTGTSSAANPSATLGSALQAGSVTYAAADFESSAGALSAGSGYAALGSDVSQSLAWIISEWNSAGSTSASASNSTTANRHSIILIEIAAAPAAAPGSAFALVPPGRQSPMAFGWRARPTQAPVLVSDSDTGSAAESSSTALSSGDTGAGAESSSTALSDSDAGSAAESSSTALSSGDTGSAAESSSTALSSGDTGAAAESSSTALSSGDTGSAAEGGSAAVIVPAPPAGPLIPPGRKSPAAFRLLRPTPPPPPAAIAVSDSDAGSAAESELIEIPPPPDPQGGWWQYLEIRRYREQERQFWASNPPMSCPRCGEPLTNAPPTDSGSSVELFCRFDGWEFPGDWRPPI